MTVAPSPLTRASPEHLREHVGVTEHPGRALHAAVGNLGELGTGSLQKANGSTPVTCLRKSPQIPWARGPSQALSSLNLGTLQPGPLTDYVLTPPLPLSLSTGQAAL